MSKHRNFWKAGTCVPFLSWYVSLYSAVFKGALYAVWRPQKGLLAISDFNISWLPLLAFSLMTWGGASSTPLIKEGWREKQRQRSAVWGKDFFQFLAALAVLPRSIWKNTRNSTVSFKPIEAKQLARQGIEQNLPPKQTRWPLPLLLSPSIIYGTNKKKEDKYESCAN